MEELKEFELYQAYPRVATRLWNRSMLHPHRQMKEFMEAAYSRTPWGLLDEFEKVLMEIEDGR